MSKKRLLSIVISAVILLSFACTAMAVEKSERYVGDGSNYLASTKSYTYTEILHYYYDNSSYNNPSVGIVKIN